MQAEWKTPMKRNTCYEVLAALIGTACAALAG
jgi:hypothetical protein